MARMTDEQILVTQATNQDNETVQELAQELLRERALTKELMTTLLALGVHRDEPHVVAHQIEHALTVIHLHELA